MRRGYFTPPVLIILAIIIFAVAILIALNTDLVKRLKKEPSPTSAPSPIAQYSSPTPDETANWKTYEDKQNKFTIKYPDYPKVNIYQTDEKNNFPPVPYCTKSISKIADFALEMSSQETMNKNSANSEITPDLYLTIAVFLGEKDIGLEKWYEQNCFDQGGSRSEIVLDGIKGLEISGGLGMGGENARIVLLPKNDKIYFISSDSSPNISEKVISTFKFLD